MNEKFKIVRINPEYKGEPRKKKERIIEEEPELDFKKKEERPFKDTSIEMRASASYEKNKSDTTLSKEQYIKLFIMDEMMETVKNNPDVIINNDKKAELDEKSLGELLNILDNKTYKEFFSDESYTCSFIASLRKKLRMEKDNSTKNL